MSVERMSDGRGWCSGPPPGDGTLTGVFCYLWEPQPQVSGWRACRETWTAGHIVASTFERADNPTAAMSAAGFSVGERAAFRAELER